MVFRTLRGFHVDRSRDYQATPAYRLDRVKEALGDVYKCHYPRLREINQTPRHGSAGARFVSTSQTHGPRRMRSPLHVVERKASFRSVSGFEAADYFGGKMGR